jgi:signal transduction histidine kinase/DNA-binding NarL/FixJ family response regulator/ligand-binding sensor domain-containing protein
MRKRSEFPVFVLVIIMAVGLPAALHGVLPFTTYYDSQLCDSQPQSWSIVQDRLGIIYIANQGGLLTYDGVSWSTAAIPNHTVRSIAITDDDTIFVGGRDEIGFFAAGPRGHRTYTSLCTELSPSQRQFGTVWGTHTTPQGVFFWTSKHLIRWDRVDRRIKVWKAKGVFSPSFLCAGEYYIRDRSIGLMKIKGDTLIPVKGGELFAGTKLFALLSRSGGELLAITRSGMYLYDGTTTVPYTTGILNYLKELEVNCGMRLANGDIALGTRLGGLLILSQDGKLKEIIDKAAGLPDNMIRNIFQDLQGNVWIAQDKGIAKIEYASPFRIFNDQNSNLPGIVLSVARDGSGRRLFAGTTTGLHIQKQDGTFQPVQQISGVVWSLLAVDTGLLAATNRGIVQLSGNTATRLTKSPTYTLIQSNNDASRIWAGTQWGLLSLRKGKGSGWYKEEHRFDNIQANIRSIVEDNNGFLWAGTLTQGVANAKISNPLSSGQITVNHYNRKHGLPPGEIHIFPVAGQALFATTQGIFTFDPQALTFATFAGFSEKFAGGPNGASVFRIAEAGDKHVWLHSLKRNFQAIPLRNGQYKLEERVFRYLPMTQVNSIFPDPAHNAAWFAAVNGLIHYDTSSPKETDSPFNAVIRDVLINGEPCALSSVPTLEYRDRNVLFKFAAPYFESETKTEYRCLLDGYDKNWAPWEKKTEKNYTNLDPGPYTFKVQAKNIYGTLSREDSFAFTILPPWYLTWWALVSYVLTGLAAIFLFAAWRSRHLAREKRQLEQIIDQRTREIKKKNIQLEEMDRIKARFFANITHEFRTPLTLIMAPLDKMLAEQRLQPFAGDLRMMVQNSRRLLNLINQLLKLAQFDSGAMKLQTSRQDILPFLKGILRSFDALAEKNQLKLSFDCSDSRMVLFFDPEKMEEVMNNLLSNAIKFTPPGGNITVSVRAGTAHTTITVRDTGPGIPREELSTIFDRFYQADNTYEYHAQGSGIGLAIAKEIVELHHGTISATNHNGGSSGAEIEVSLPQGKDHLLAEEITPASQTEWKPLEKPDTPLVELTPTSQELQESPVQGLNKDIVLVIEDSPDLRRFIRSALEPNYAVLEAENGEQGVAKAREIIPDLILCDVMMPVMDGCEATRLLKNDKATSHIPIVLLTAKAGEENILAGLETMADDYIVKPFNIRLLRARLKNLIAMRRRLQQTIDAELTFPSSKIKLSPIDREFMDELHKIIEENIGDPDFNVEELSRKLYLNRATVYRKIHALTGETPTEFIRSFRLKRGAELLKNNFGTILDVALEVGFSSANYFTKCFKQKFNRLPSDIRPSNGK